MTHRFIRTVLLPNHQEHTFADDGVAQVAARDDTVFAFLILFVIVLGHAVESPADDLPDPILEVFPESQAPAFYDKESKLELQRSFQAWARNSNWHPDVDEKSVFHARLQHKSVDERCWEIGIGKGGQMYSICSSFGEAMPPQKPDSQWMDETWQFTTIYGHLLGRDLPQQKQRYGNAFVHQSGIYTRDEDAESTSRKPAAGQPPPKTQRIPTAMRLAWSSAQSSTRKVSTGANLATTAATARASDRERKPRQARSWFGSEMRRLIAKDNQKCSA